MQLRTFHEEPASSSCQTCYYRDLCALGLVSRAWDRAVRPKLYERIYLVGSDSPAHIKKYKMKYGVRLKLLRRTLRDRRVLANYVRELKLPRLAFEPGKGQNLVDMVAAVVMACPNLERLVGFYQTYGHEFDRLTYALSARRRLKEHVWIIGRTQQSHRGLITNFHLGSWMTSKYIHFFTTILLGRTYKLYFFILRAMVSWNDMYSKKSFRFFLHYSIFVFLISIKTTLMIIHFKPYHRLNLYDSRIF